MPISNSGRKEGRKKPWWEQFISDERENRGEKGKREMQADG